MTEDQAQELAAWQAQSVVNALRAAGWMFVAVVVYAAKDGPGRGVSGASYFDISKRAAGALPTLADNVRTLARAMDDSHRAIGAPRWDGESYSHTVAGTGVDAMAARARESDALDRRLAAWLESGEFFDLMQAYRTAPLVPLGHAAERYEAIKAAIRKAVRS